jgi:hypothetical protein
MLNLDGRPPELYQRATDRWEQENVAADRPEIVDRLELVVRRFADEIDGKL